MRREARSFFFGACTGAAALLLTEVEAVVVRLVTQGPVGFNHSGIN
jgi:hypothetical protein